MMLLPWYAAPLIGTIAAVALLLILRNSRIAVIVYCVLPVVNFVLFLFCQPLLMYHWVAVSMISVGFVVLLLHRFLLGSPPGKIG
jgi:hypothetical protein